MRQPEKLTIATGQARLDDLYERLARTRWSAALPKCPQSLWRSCGASLPGRSRRRKARPGKAQRSFDHRGRVCRLLDQTAGPK